MAGIICELCGGGTLVRQGNGMYVCKDCGTEYTLEAARQLLQGGGAPAPAQTANSDFEINAGTLVKYKGVSPIVEIPRTVKILGCECFSGLSVERVTIPDTVKEIGKNAFEDCKSLNSIEIPDGVTEIGEYAFFGCTSLTSLTIPNGVKKIEESTFIRCTRLTSVTIPNSVTKIGKSAFNGCTNLTSITIPNSVTEIGQGAFFGCTGLTSLTIPNSVTTIGRNAFAGCTGLTSISIPNNVKRIDCPIFGNCFSLDPTKIQAPTHIEWLFNGCFDRTKFCPHCAGRVKTGLFGSKCTRCGRTI